jgi:ankyrin repeat protein
LDFLEAPLHPRVARPAMELLFSCEGEANYRSWIVDLEDVLLAYNLSAANSMSRGPLELGWFHDILLGSFHAAACTGDLECLRFHIFDKMRNKETIDCVDGAGMTALQWAALRGQEACVRLLLSHGANPNLKQPGGNTSLHLAVTRGHEAIARLLIEEGKVDVTAKNLQVP